MNRGVFLRAGAAAIAAPFADGMKSEAETVATAGAEGTTFSQWIVRNQVASSGLVRYYRNGPHAHEESPLATAYAILYFVEHDLQYARRFGNALISLQSSMGGNRFVGGGVPSIANDNSQLYYSSDALIALKAMVTLWRATRDDRYRKSAAQFVDFIRRLTYGTLHGMLAQDVGFPMHYATPDGTFQNQLVPNVSMLFWDSLRDYGIAFGDSGALKFFDDGRRFLLANAQAPNGAFYDHYDPGYPPVPYSPNRWRWFKIETTGHPVAIGDNMMMAALGAQALGGGSIVDRFLNAVASHNGTFYAYVDLETRGSGFMRGDRPYIDIVDSAMYAVLLQRAGRGMSPVIGDVKRVLAQSRSSAGGFRWGQYLSGDWVDDGAEALVTGYWAQLVS
jgi:hypothetical protein